ncbi:MAG: hypothetical protein AB7E46_07270 [Desulfovibrio sp.]
MSPAASTRAVDAARAAWAEFGGCPEWIIALAEECDRASQRTVAARIGYSAGAVNQVLAAKYKAPLRNIEKAVRGAFLSATVLCPVVGELAADRCLDQQKKPWSSSPLRLRMFKACRSGCPHSRITPNAKETAC